MCGRSQPGLGGSMALFRGQVAENAAIAADFRRAAMLREGLSHAHAVGGLLNG